MQQQQFLLLFLLFTHVLSYRAPRLIAKRLSSEPLLSFWKGNSNYLYNYNVATFSSSTEKGIINLAVRVQNLTRDAKSVYDVAASEIAFATLNLQTLEISTISSQGIFYMDHVLIVRFISQTERRTLSSIGCGRSAYCACEWHVFFVLHCCATCWQSCGTIGAGHVQ